MILTKLEIFSFGSITFSMFAQFIYQCACLVVTVLICILCLLVQIYANMEEEGGYVMQKCKYKLLKIKYLVHKPLAVTKFVLFVSK